MGELTAAFTIKIIETFQPKYWYIENPAFSRIWLYIKKYINFFDGIDNFTHYKAYGKEYPKKPTKFLSNIFLNLKQTKEKSKVIISKTNSNKRYVDVKQISNYDECSKIPSQLIQSIVDTIMEKEIHTYV
jgi:hypothetical protein